MSKLISPYHAPNFYADALGKGRHRDIVGGRWDEIGRAQLELLKALGLRPGHVLLDVGAGSLRLGCKVVPYLDKGNYWATDMSRELLLRGFECELEDKGRLDPDRLVEDGAFDFPGLPPTITHAFAFAVFTHLPSNYLRRALLQIEARFPALEMFVFTVFLAPNGKALLGSLRQPDGVVTHDTRAPYHMLEVDVLHLCETSGFSVLREDVRLPRGQALFVARRTFAP